MASHAAYSLFASTLVLATPCLAQPADTSASPRYVIPDLGTGKQLLPDLQTRFVDARFGLELIADLTGFQQDETSIAQVGEQRSAFEIRSASIGIEGEFGPEKRLGYRATVEVNGFNTEENQTLAITDFSVSIDFARWNTRLSVGEIRERFSYEVVGSTVTMPQSERVMSPFAASHNAGAALSHMFAPDNRMTLSYGLYRDTWGFGDGKLSMSARITGLAIDNPSQTQFLHLGASFRHAGSDGTMRYRARPGVSAASNFVDTGDMPARNADHIGLEIQYASGPWSVLAEYAAASVKSEQTGNPRFQGFYVVGSWILTGESRPYDRRAGLVRRITPKGRWGAPELVARYAIVDLNGGTIEGGQYQRVEAGMNWWATTRWKLGVLGGRIWLDRFGQQSVTTSILTRLQWVY